MKPIPAPGYQRISGHRAPPKTMGEYLWCQIRGSGATKGWCDSVPWPVNEVRWVHDGTAGDVVAIRRAD